MLNKMFFAATATAALIASFAMADGYFTYFDGTPQEDDTTIELGVVTADADGMVVIYDYNGGEIGEILGTEMVTAGANADVKVNITPAPGTILAAVLYSGEPTSPADAVDWVEIDLEG